MAFHQSKSVSGGSLRLHRTLAAVLILAALTTCSYNIKIYPNKIICHDDNGCPAGYSCVIPSVTAPDGFCCADGRTDCYSSSVSGGAGGAGGAGLSGGAGGATGSPATVPASPSSLSATSTVCDQIQLIWRDNSNNETGFKLERAPVVGGSCGSYGTLATVAADATTYTDTGLTANTEYCYRICASNPQGDSSWMTCSSTTFHCSSSGSCTANNNCYNGCCLTVDQTPPEAPSSMQATSTVCNQMQITWKDNANNESGFKLERAPVVSGDCGSYTALTTVPAGSTSYTDTGLTANTEYCYRMCAWNPKGDSSWVTSSSTTFHCYSSGSCTANNNCYNGCCLPLDQTPPEAPSSMQATSTVCNQMQITWKDNANNESAFKLERAPVVSGNCGSYTALRTVPAGSTSYTDTGLTANTEYCYRMCAWNPRGDSPWVTSSSTTFHCSSSSSCQAGQTCSAGCCI